MGVAETWGDGYANRGHTSGLELCGAGLCVLSACLLRPSSVLGVCRGRKKQQCPPVTGDRVPWSLLAPGDLDREASGRWGLDQDVSRRTRASFCPTLTPQTRKSWEPLDRLCRGGLGSHCQVPSG